MDNITLRNKFIEFFRSHGHEQFSPAPLIPENDSSVLFTTAGMQQFKQFYRNPELTSSARIVSIQPCIRTSDIDEVGDNSHLTFFEMLGNFSFGYPSNKHSYFKKEAIEFSYEFLNKHLKIPKNKLSITIFPGSKNIPFDKESVEIARKLGIDDKNIKTGDEKDNFWSLGTEGSPAGSTVEFYADELEVWNLVFNEYTLNDGNYIPSKHKGVDTGMGFERLLAILQGKTDIYETDIFKPIINKIEEISDKKYQNFPREFRIISDHVRAVSNLLEQGVLPANTGQGYIVRRLIRRSIRRAHILGMFNNPISVLGDEYIRQSNETINSVVVTKIITYIKSEEERFKFSLDKIALYKDDLIMAIKYNVIKRINGIPIITNNNVASGKYISENYQSYGTPYDLSIRVAQELGLKYDKAGFEELQQAHRDKSRFASAGMFKGGLASGGEREIKYHTATHLLLAALRETFGPDIYQKGSNITAERLRFDFNYPEKLSDDQIKKIEHIVNEKIKENIPVTMVEMAKKEALKSVKVSFDPSKYGDTVKVYSIGDFSSELCGGPHVKNTGEIKGDFKIIKEESSSAGIRRIKAVIE